jgi:hypothetical protein
MKQRGIALLFIALFTLCNPLQSAPLFLVQEGKSTATIIIPKNPSLTESFAAEELSSYIQKSTGAAIAILTEAQLSSYDPSKPYILVGETEQSKSLGISPTAITKGGFLVKRINNFLILRGEDDRISYNPGGTSSPTDPKQRSQTRHGTLFAVYDILEKNLGIRWYWPGPLGEIVPSHTTFAIDLLDYYENPAFEYRSRYGYWLDDPDFGYNESILWWRRMRCGGAGYHPATHSFAKYVELYGKSHPEYFALQKDGTRLTNTRHGGGHICFSNKEFQKILIADLIDTFKKRPDLYTLNVMPGDSFERYCCQCEECKAQYDENAQKLPQSHATFINPNGKHSRIVWNYVNEVAREIRKTLPDRYIGCCAYASYFLPPANIKFEPNVSVTICRGNVDLYFWDPIDIELSHSIIQKWGALSNLIFTWEYPCGAQVYGNAVIFPHGINEEVKRMHASNIKGSIIEYPPCYEPSKYGGSYTGWMRELPTTYILFKSLWNMDLDVGKIMDEFCRDLYGPAEIPMKQFFTRMEKIWKEGNHGTKPYYANWSNIWTSLYSEENLDILFGYLKRAEKIAPEGIYKKRVQKTIQGFSTFEQNR